MNGKLQTNKLAVLIGLGKTGISCARHLQGLGWSLAATDSRAEPPGAAEFRALAPQAVLRCGGFDLSLLDGAGCVVVSPGVSLAEPIVQQARASGLDVVGDIELFARAATAPVIGITGTNGKSTVTTLLGRMAERAGIRVQVGGNLGTPALDLLGRSDTQLYVLELSSFQLDTAASLQLLAAVVLNVSADHLDRYGTLDAYAASKASIYRRCGTAVVNGDDPCVASMPLHGSQRVGFSLRATGANYTLQNDADGNPALAVDGMAVLPLSLMRLTGLHNAANALAALALGAAAKLPMPVMLDELKSFPGLPHRSQWVAEIAGVRYVNDSKGTNVGATLAAVQGMSGTLVLIAGGDGKGQDFAPLAAAFASKVRFVALIGRDAPALEQALRGVCATQRCGDLDAAVQVAARAAQPGDTVLLSPACASLDMFRDYTQRGDVFVSAVRRLAA